MNWQAEAVDRLTGYLAMRQSLRAIPQELKRLEMEATALRGSNLSGIGCPRDRDAREDMILNNLVKRHALAYSLEQARLHTSLTEQSLGCLTPEERRLLELFYIKAQWGNVNQLCVEMGLSKTTLYRKREEALRKFTVALYGPGS